LRKADGEVQEQRRLQLGSNDIASQDRNIQTVQNPCVLEGV
jgi:hypothetical protein